MWDRFECSGRCLRRVVCQGCWCRSFPKKSIDPVLAPKVNRMTIFSIAFNKKNEGLWNDGFSCISPCFALTSWRLKHLTPGDHFCRIWTLEPFFCRSPTKSCTSGRTQDQASSMPTGMETEEKKEDALASGQLKMSKSSTGILLGCQSWLKHRQVHKPCHHEQITCRSDSECVCIFLQDWCSWVQLVDSELKFCKVSALRHTSSVTGPRLPQGICFQPYLCALVLRVTSAFCSLVLTELVVPWSLRLLHY